MPADVDISGMAIANPSIGLASDAPHNVPLIHGLSGGLHTVVSTSNVPFLKVQNNSAQSETARKETISSQRTIPVRDGGNAMPNASITVGNQMWTPHWYALRTTYGRERQAYEYITSHGGTAYWPTMEAHKIRHGRRQTLRVSRIPNILFAHGTQTEVQTFVYDNINLPFLRFYYGVQRIGRTEVRQPLIVPERQIESLRIICEVDDGNVALIPQQETRFLSGQLVRITHGRFAGVEGRVARYHGQQRVAVMVEGLFCIATAYIPTAFLQVIPE